jgi:peroxiredoxin
MLNSNVQANLADFALVNSGTSAKRPVARPSGKRRLLRLIGGAITLLLLLAVLALLLINVVGDGLPAGQNAPDFSGRDLQGNSVQLADYRGKPLMLTFWSPDCFACREELPALQAIAADPNSNVTLLTIVSGSSPVTVGAFVQEQGLTFPVIVDEPGAIAARYAIHGIPFTYFINQSGVIERSVMGAGGAGELQNSLFAWLKSCQVNEVCTIEQ